MTYTSTFSQCHSLSTPLKKVRSVFWCTQWPNWTYLMLSSSVEGTINWTAPIIINLDDINYYCAKYIIFTKSFHSTCVNNHLLAKYFTATWWSSCTARTHYEYKWELMNINKKIMNSHIQIWIFMNLTPKKVLPLAFLLCARFVVWWKRWQRKVLKWRGWIHHTHPHLGCVLRPSSLEILKSSNLETDY